jgi:hypothetical protein
MSFSLPDAFVWCMFIASPITLLVHLYLNAPIGQRQRPVWGPSLNPRQGKHAGN